jgi:cephalosporin-C deacetylase-like acetyl esterase
MTSKSIRLALQALVLALVATARLLAQNVTLSPVTPSGVFGLHEPIAWEVATTGGAIRAAKYRVMRDGLAVVKEGTLDLSSGKGRVEGPALEKSGTLLAEVTFENLEKKKTRALGGAVVAPDGIAPALPAPDDFDRFWQAKLAELAAVPMQLKIEPAESGVAGVDYFKLTLANVRGRTIHAQLARPTAGAKFPAMVLYQWAGVYGLAKENVTDRAKEGWLALNYMAHDLPIDESPEFYKAQAAGPLANYETRGNYDREQSYLLPMLLGAYRVTDYLMSRSDWNGRTLVASGASQGGFQTIAIAALQPKITAAITVAPAGCDLNAEAANRAAGWPFWMAHNPAPAHDRAALFEAARYFDAVNFAARVRVPMLVAVGLIDTTCPPSGELAMANQLKGPKEIGIFPLADHNGSNNSRAPFRERIAAWREALRSGRAPLP